MILSFLLINHVVMAGYFLRAQYVRALRGIIKMLRNKKNSIDQKDGLLTRILSKHTASVVSSKLESIVARARLDRHKFAMHYEQVLNHRQTNSMYFNDWGHTKAE